MERNRVESITPAFFRRSCTVMLLVLALAAAVATCALAKLSPAYAAGNADPIGVVQCENNNLYATSFKQINDELVKMKGKTVIIDMYCDWNARDTSAEGVAVPEHLVIPAGTRATLNMNGYMIDRGLSGNQSMSKSGGEVIQVQGGATLTINGGSTDEAKGRTHDAYVYVSTERNGFVEPTQQTFTGGLIAGGNNKNGAGGIRMLSGSTVTLNDVTIAGCRAQAPTSGDPYGSGGGGIRMEGGSTTLNMNNSIITGCFAKTGGGIYIDETSKGTVNLQTSHVDANYAREEGGGINLGGFRKTGSQISIIGDGKSSVSRNQCETAGGGINAYSSKTSIQELTLEQNSASRGGGINTHNDSVSLYKLVITGNTADAYGGGAAITSFVASDTLEPHYTGDSLISGCTVQGNSAPKGGGILFNDYNNQRPWRKRVISGVTVVKDNTSTDGGINNLLIATGLIVCSKQALLRADRMNSKRRR